MSGSQLLLPAIGGTLIGLGAALLLWSHGKVAGISGILGGLMAQKLGANAGFQWAFLAGLVSAGAVIAQWAPQAFSQPSAPLGVVAFAGVLVGYGTRLGNGCTSGHGVCGVSRGSLRSLVATIVFMGFGVVTVYGVRHALRSAL